MAEDDFHYHHAKRGFASLYKWIAEDETDNIPAYPYTNLGVAGLVIDSQDRALVVQEKYTIKGLRPWKFPGGTANQGEDIGETAEREVLEETGVRCKFHSILMMRHLHKYQFGTSDFFITCLMKVDESSPDALKLQKCEQEIHDVAWIPIDELVSQLSDFNRSCLDKYSLMKKTGLGLKYEKVPFILGGEVGVYALNRLDDVDKE